jgi:hypothetical protein
MHIHAVVYKDILYERSDKFLNDLVSSVILIQIAYHQSDFTIIYRRMIRLLNAFSFNSTFNI